MSLDSTGRSESRVRLTVAGLLAICASLGAWALEGEPRSQLGGPEDRESLRTVGEDPVVATFRAPLHEHELAAFEKHFGTEVASRETLAGSAALTRWLAAEAEAAGLAESPAHRVLRRQLLGRVARGALRRQFAASTVVSDDEVEAKYQEIKDSYALPRRVRLRNIFLAYPPQADDRQRAETRQRLQTLREEIVAGASFAALASRHSDSQTRLQGGLIGNVRPGHFGPALDRLVVAMEAGDLSEVIATADGVHLFYCEQVLEARSRTEEELREVARDLVWRTRHDTAWWEFERASERRAALEVDWQALESGPAGRVAATYLGGVLTQEEIAELLPQRVGVTLDDRGRIAVRERLSAFVQRQVFYIEALERELWGESQRWEFTWRRRSTLATDQLARLVQERLQPFTEAQLRRFYEAERDSFQRPDTYDLWLIVLPLDGEDPRGSWARARRLRAGLIAGDLEFAEVARSESVHASRKEGGRLVQQPRPAVRSLLGIDGLRQLRELALGELSRPFESDGRLMMLRLDAFEARRPATFEEARTQVDARLGSLYVADLERQVRTDLLARLGFREGADG